jgi:hypothetical protein
LPDSSATTWILLIHGSGDGPERWAQPMIELLRPRVPVAVSSDVQFVAWDWKEAARDKLTAAERGQAEGVALAEALRSTNVRYLHVIAHSAGAHVALGLEQALAEWPDRRPVVQLTLLDPFLGKGLDFEWARSRLGAHSDFVEQWINVGDGVPGTETTVDAAHVFDVSHSVAKPQGLTGSQAHWWPIDAYPLLDRGTLEPGFYGFFGFTNANLKVSFPPGVTEAVP